jgi:uncharacterized protein (TIGR04255 family)
VEPLKLVYVPGRPTAQFTGSTAKSTIFLDMAASQVSQESLTNPPIIEALAQINFESPIEVTSLMSGFLAFVKAEKIDDIIQINILPQNKVETAIAGHRLILQGGVVIIQITPTFVAVSTLGKYPGWSSFETLFKPYFEEILKLGKIENVTTISLRYINNFSVPYQTGINEALRVRPEYKEQNKLQPTKMVCSFEAPILGDLGSCLINESVEARPSENKWIMVVDIESRIKGNMKPDMSEILTNFQKLRAEKNIVFKKVLTESAYDLFR